MPDTMPIEPAVAYVSQKTLSSLLRSGFESGRSRSERLALWRKRNDMKDNPRTERYKFIPELIITQHNNDCPLNNGHCDNGTKNEEYKKHGETNKEELNENFLELPQTKAALKVGRLVAPQKMGNHFHIDLEPEPVVARSIDEATRTKLVDGRTDYLIEMEKPNRKLSIEKMNIKFDILDPRKLPTTKNCKDQVDSYINESNEELGCSDAINVTHNADDVQLSTTQSDIEGEYRSPTNDSQSLAEFNFGSTTDIPSNTNPIRRTQSVTTMSFDDNAELNELRSKQNSDCTLENTVQKCENSVPILQVNDREVMGTSLGNNLLSADFDVTQDAGRRCAGMTNEQLR